MSTPSRPNQPLELVPIEEAAPASEPQQEAPASVADPAADDVPRVDRFIARAAAEFRAGRIDQPLWTHVVAQSGGDEKTARSAYLRARAAALQVADRERAARPPDGATGDGGAPPAAARRAAPRPKPWMYGAAVALVVVVVGSVVLLGARKQTTPAPPVASAAPAARPATPAPAPRPTVDTTLASGSATEPSLESRVDQLVAAGNWNVVVLTATEWTRKEPSNSAAWLRLGMGYARLGQLDEAFDATRKATDVAPSDAAAWRTLGEMNVARSQPAAALAAYQKAVALDERDTATMVRVGLLNAQLDHLPEAKDAFDKVLAVRADDTDALCGQAYVARQQGRRKDAEAIVRDLKAADRSCRELSDALGMPQFAAPASKSVRH